MWLASALGIRLYALPCYCLCSTPQGHVYSIAVVSVLQAEEQIGECMLYTLAEWAKEQLTEWLEESVVERSQPSASNASDTAASPAQAKEV